MPDAAAFAARAAARRKQLDRAAGEASQVARRGIETRDRVKVLRASLERHERVSGVLTKVSEQRQEQAQRQVEELVTRALQVVFGENLSFHIVTSIKANRSEVDFILRSTYGGETVDTAVVDARGGGMVAVVAFALRLVILLLTPGARRFLALDESFAHVSASYEPRVAEFLREVADKAGVQILLVTHSSAYGDVADSRYRLVLGSDGVTKVQEGQAE